METAPVWPEVAGYAAYLALVCTLGRPVGRILDRITGAEDVTR